MLFVFSALHNLGVGFMALVIVVNNKGAVSEILHIEYRSLLRILIQIVYKTSKITMMVTFLVF